MFDKMADKIDAVTVGVPDHAHFPITIEAMAHGKHVYVEKPMARTFHEIEVMMRAEKKFGVVTQMGNQGTFRSQLLPVQGMERSRFDQRRHCYNSSHELSAPLA